MFELFVPLVVLELFVPMVVLKLFVPMVVYDDDETDPAERVVETEDLRPPAITRVVPMTAQPG